MNILVYYILPVFKIMNLVVLMHTWILTSQSKISFIFSLSVKVENCSKLLPVKVVVVIVVEIVVVVVVVVVVVKFSSRR